MQLNMCSVFKRVSSCLQFWKKGLKYIVKIAVNTGRANGSHPLNTSMI